MKRTTEQRLHDALAAARLVDAANVSYQRPPPKDTVILSACKGSLRFSPLKAVRPENPTRSAMSNPCLSSGSSALSGIGFAGRFSALTGVGRVTNGAVWG
jgi:hypothetical protein